jgi:ABC-2 type transport system permease protein
VSAVRKYWAFARIGAAQAASERGELFGRALFFGVLLGVFSALWRAIAEAGMPLAVEPERLVWYLAATEWILLSTPQRQNDIQEEVRRGDVAYQLARPVSFARAQLAQCWGALLVRSPLLAVAALIWVYLFTGDVPELGTLCWLAPFGLAASAVLAQLFVALGLVSFWLTDATPLYWVVGKLSFVLGGLMLPLELYPGWLQRVAAVTPFPALLSQPAGFVLHGTGAASALALRLVLWAVFLFAVVELLFWRAARSLELGGG